MNFISRNTDYAVRALIYMADAGAKDRENVVTVKDIVEKEGLPERFLRRILQRLARKGIIRSYKGKAGGFSFLKAPDKIKLTDIIEIFQGKIDLTNCLLKGKVCTGMKRCALRLRLKEIGSFVDKELRRITIASLS